MVKMDQRGILVSMVLLEFREKLVKRVNKDHRVLKECKVILGVMETQVQKVYRVIEDMMEKLVNKGPRAQKVNKVKQGQMENKVCPVILVKKEIKVNQVIQELLDLKVKLDKEVIRVLWVSKE
jgi:hypothetical protein